MIKYGKPVAPLLKHKQSFFEDNDELIEKYCRINSLYKIQPRRTQCKNCTAPLGEPSFTKLGIDYTFCARCLHLNGMHEDTEKFCRAVYTEDDGKEYADNYLVSSIDDYQSRVKDIYLPKAEFLCKALKEQGKVDPKKLTYADLGSGSGYFVAALLKQGMSKVYGYEASNSQIALAKKMNQRAIIACVGLDEIVNTALTVKADVVSMIGVLEHTQEPYEILSALKSNPSVQWIFISVPLFSPSVFFEMAFPNIFNRHLSAGHTHLYTDKSLNWLCQNFNFDCVSEWWFGNDMMDVFRSVAVSISQSHGNKFMVDKWNDMFVQVLDALQLEIDKKHLSSEVHMLLKVNK